MKNNEWHITEKELPKIGRKIIGENINGEIGEFYFVKANKSKRLDAEYVPAFLGSIFVNKDYYYTAEEIIRWRYKYAV